MTLIEALVWLGGAGVAAVSAFLFERLQPFQGLSGNGKTIVAVTGAVLIAAGATWLQGFLAASPDVVARIEPYWQLVYSGIVLVVQQLTHGALKEPKSANG